MNYRDAVIQKIDETHYFVTGCDSCGGIGKKSADNLEVSPYVVGYMTARVALLEVLTLGAEVMTVAVPICNEPDPTGRLIITGVEKCLKDFGIEAKVVSSMEKNMSTQMTAVGVVASGLAKSIRMGQFCSGDKIYIVGRPSVGEEVMAFKEEILNTDTVIKLLQTDGIREILPGGSNGLLKELEEMLSAHICEVQMEHSNRVDMLKSCGPATSAIVVADSELVMDLDIPVICIGHVL